MLSPAGSVAQPEQSVRRASNRNAWVCMKAVRRPLKSERASVRIVCTSVHILYF